MEYSKISRKYGMKRKIHVNLLIDTPNCIENNEKNAIV